MENALEYDAIASGVFAPLYPVVAEAILERTGVVSGRSSAAEADIWALP